MLMMKLETIEHARFRALSQIVIDKEKGVEAFEEYMKLAFPYLEATKKRDRDSVLTALSQEVNKGPLAVHVQRQPTGKSRYKQTVEKTQAKRNPERANSLYKKLGDLIPK